MKINSINSMMYTQRAMNNVKKSNVSFGECDGACCKEIDLKKGMNGETLQMKGDALKYFDVVENLSNAKVGSKFIIRPRDVRWDDINLLITPETQIKGETFEIGIAKKDDVIILAGKGHEPYQILNTGTIHFDDREQVQIQYDRLIKGVE